MAGVTQNKTGMYIKETSQQTFGTQKNNLGEDVQYIYQLQIQF